MTEVTLQSWSPSDLETLRRANTVEMTTFLGEPETEAAIVDRHHRYLRLIDEGIAHMFRIVIEGHPAGVGSIGVWTDEHQSGGALEIGWAVESAHQGRGIASAAVRAVLTRARELRGDVPVHAYPRVENAASNAICRRTGFTLIGQTSFEYPKGSWAVSNEWVHQR